MRRMRHRIVLAIGLLFLAGGPAAAQAQSAKRAPEAAAPVKYRLERIDGRLYRVPVRESFLPGFRVPPSWNEPAVRAAPAPLAAAPPQAARPVAHARTSRQAVRAQQPSRPVHRASLAVAEPSGYSRYRPSALVAEARRYLGTNPTKMARRWCARFMNFVLGRVGLPGTGSDAAKSFAFYGKRISGPQYGAIAVLTRKGGGHVGIVTGVDRHGNPILIAGNNGRRQVGISVYPKRRVIAYVMPDGRPPAKPARLAGAKPMRVASAKTSRTGTR